MGFMFGRCKRDFGSVFDKTFLSMRDVNADRQRSLYLLPVLVQFDPAVYIAARCFCWKHQSRKDRSSFDGRLRGAPSIFLYLAVIF